MQFKLIIKLKAYCLIYFDISATSSRQLINNYTSRYLPKIKLQNYLVTTQNNIQGLNVKTYLPTCSGIAQKHLINP